MTRLARSTVLSVALVLAAACGSSTGPADHLAVSVTGTTFERGDAGFAAVPWEIVNEGSRTLVLSTCGGSPLAVVDRLESGRWAQHSGAICISSVYTPPIELEPGASAEGAYPLRDAGVYRLRFGVSERASERFDWGATSEAFEVR